MRYAAAFREESGIEFPLLVDRDRIAYKAIELNRAGPLHVLRLDNNRRRLAAMAAGHREHRPGPHPLQLGGSFVFAPGDRDLFVHVSETFSDNADPRELIEALME